MRNQYKVLAEKYDQVNEIGFAPGMSPKDDPRILFQIKSSIWEAVNANSEGDMLAHPNGEVINKWDIYKALKSAKTFKEVETVFFNYGLDYIIHSNPE